MILTGTLHLESLHLVLSVDLCVLTSQLIHQYSDFDLLGLVSLISQNRSDALPVESVQTREDIELSIEDSSITNVTALRRVDRDVLIALVSLLVA